MGSDGKESAAERWRRELKKFWADLTWDSWTEPPSLRALLYKLYIALNDTPGNLLQEFDQFNEKALSSEARDSMLDLRGTKGSIHAKDNELLWNAAVALRTLDEMLDEAAEDVSEAEGVAPWAVAGGKAYVVPVPRAVVNEGGPRTGQSFSRRGLLHHRIIPAQIDDVAIVLELHPDLTCGVMSSERLFGAALFPELNLKIANTGGRFLATSVDCAGGAAVVVDRHCDSAHSRKCDTLIWPELTMDSMLVQQVSRRFATNPMETALPPVVVAGSWHIAQQGCHQNLAPVLDGRGGHLFNFGKSRRFSFNGLVEDVEVYGKIHILVTDQELIAFAICKDFCDKASAAVPVVSLDVDLVLVPSMGQASTITAHREAADAMKVQFGTRVVVVQQTYPLEKEGAPVGYVLKALKNPRAAEVVDLAEKLEFTTFQRQL